MALDFANGKVVSHVFIWKWRGSNLSSNHDEIVEPQTLNMNLVEEIKILLNRK